MRRDRFAAILQCWDGAPTGGCCRWPEMRRCNGVEKGRRLSYLENQIVFVSISMVTK
jgi:hypothetical protein